MDPPLPGSAQEKPPAGRPLGGLGQAFRLAQDDVGDAVSADVACWQRLLLDLPIDGGDAVHVRLRV